MASDATPSRDRFEPGVPANLAFALQARTCGGSGEASEIEWGAEQYQFMSAAQEPGVAVLGVGGPGTGKTRALIQAVTIRAASSAEQQRIVVLTWSRSAAQSLRRAIVAGTGASQLSPGVFTVYGWCLGLQRRYGPDPASTPRLLTAPEQEFRLRELLTGWGAELWPESLRRAVLTTAFVGQVRQSLARMRQLGLDPDDVVQAGESAGRPEWVSLGQFFEEYLTMLDAESAWDYAELVHRTRLLLLEPGVSEQLAANLDAVFCDEFAELDRGQLSLLADVHALGCAVVGVGDPWTTVFDFRGADPRAIADFGSMFATPVGPPSRIIWFDTPHRAHGELPQLWGRVAARLPQLASIGGSAATGVGASESARSVGPQDAQGERGEPNAQGTHQAPVAQGAHSSGPRPESVRAVEFDTPGDEERAIIEELRRAHLDEGLDWPDCAIITRAGGAAVARLARALSHAGIPVQVGGDELALSGQPAVQSLTRGLEAVLTLVAAQPLDPTEAMQLLASPLAGIDPIALRSLGRELRAHEPDGAPPRPSHQLLALALASDELDAPQLGGDAWWRLVNLRESFLAAARAVASGADAGTVMWLLWSRAGWAVEPGSQAWPGSRTQTMAGIRAGSWAARLRAEALRGGASAVRANADLDSVVALFDLAGRHVDLVGEKAVRLLLREVADQQIPADTTRESSMHNSGVALLTAHRTKGLQWQLVIVCGLQEGSWPALRRPNALLAADELGIGEVPPQPTTQIKQAVQAERRLFLLAASRASTRLLMTTNQGGEDEAASPSRFIAETGVELSSAPGRVEQNYSLTGLVAELRRTAVDPGVSVGLRDAAAVELAHLAAERDKQGNPLVPGADPACWWGLKDYSTPPRPLADSQAPIRLGVSELRVLLGCPRRWFLQYQSQAITPKDPSAILGTIIHKLIEYAQRDNFDADHAAASINQLWSQIPFDTAWLSASERVKVEAALQIFATWQATRAGVLVATEVRFEQPIEVAGDTVILTGSVDRLEHDRLGGLRIVDFKTGKTPLSKADAATDIQLGCYQLAAQLGAFDSLSGGERKLAGGVLVYVSQPNSSGLPTLRTQDCLDLVTNPDDESGSGSASDTGGGPLDKSGSGSVGELSGGSYPSWVHQKLAEAVAAIRSEQFEARRSGDCRYCPFQIDCPGYQVQAAS